MKFHIIFFHLTWIALFLSDGAFVAWLIWKSPALAWESAVTFGLTFVFYKFMMFAKTHKL